MKEAGKYLSIVNFILTFIMVIISALIWKETIVILGWITALIYATIIVFGDNKR